MPSIPEVRFSELAASGAPDFLSVPWPSDAYLEGDGTIVDTIPGFDDLRDEQRQGARGDARRAEGLRRQRRRARRGRPIRRRAIRIGTAGRCRSRSTSKSLPSRRGRERGRRRLRCSSSISTLAPRCPRVQVHDDSDLGATSPPLLSVLPARGVVLAEGHRHAVVVTTKVTAGGKPVRGERHLRRDPRRLAPRDRDREALRRGAVDDVKKSSQAARRRRSYRRPRRLHDPVDERRAGHDAREIAVAKAKPPTVDWKPADIKPMGAALFADHVVAGYTATLDAWLGTPNKLPDGTDDPATDQDGGAPTTPSRRSAPPSSRRAELPPAEAGRLHRSRARHRRARDAKGDPEIDPDHPTVKIWVTLLAAQGPGAGERLSGRHPRARPPGRSQLHARPRQHLRREGLGDRRHRRRRRRLARATDPRATARGQALELSLEQEPGRVRRPRTAISPTRTRPRSRSSPRPRTSGAVRDQLREAVIDIGTLAEVVTDPNPRSSCGRSFDAVPGARVRRLAARLPRRLVRLDRRADGRLGRPEDPALACSTSAAAAS